MKRLAPLAIVAALALPAAAQQAPSLTDHVQTLTAEGSNPFQAGMFTALRGLEKLGQAQWRYGASSGMSPMLPDVGQPNPAPETMDPDTLRTTLDTLIADMAIVRAHLDRAEAAGIQPFTLDPNTLWVDFNANGVQDKGEDAPNALRPLITGRRARRNADPVTAPTIRFDAADLHWLRAYTHMIEGAANLGLAFDPAPVLAALTEARKTLADLPEKPYPWTDAELDAEEAALKARKAQLGAEIKTLRDQMKPLQDQHRDLTPPTEGATPEQRKVQRAKANEFFEANLRQLDEASRDLSRAQSAIRRELRAIEAKRPPSPRDLTLREQMLKEMGRADIPDLRDRTRTTVDAIFIALKSLDQQPDAARLQAARDHWLRMIAINRTFWAAVEAETDDDHEWIPNPRQTSQFGLPNDPEAPAAWMRVLRDAEMVLNGDLLIPHPLLPTGTGVDLAAYIANPAPIDLIGWVQGSAAYPYTANGPRITGQYWQQFRRLTNGRATMFAFYYN